jgi:hypothetical protein
LPQTGHGTLSGMAVPGRQSVVRVSSVALL